MRLPTSNDFSDAAHRIRNKLVSVTHNNEKHVDEFDSAYSTDDFAHEIDGDVPIPTTSEKSQKSWKKSILATRGSAARQDASATILGADPVVKTYYESERSPGEGKYNWCEYPPRQMSKKQALKQDRVAIRLYKIKDADRPVIGGRHSLKNHMLQIQNPLLITALKPILKKQDIYLDPSEVADFYDPFRALYFCADEIAELQKSTKETALKNQLTLLLHVMNGIFGNVKTVVHQMQDAGLVNYKNAWIYFPKDCMVYAPGTDTERIFKVIDTRYQTRPSPAFIVKVQEIQFDGKCFAWKNAEIQIAQWVGNKPIKDLKLYPMRFHADAEAVKSRMTERGRKVLDYQGLVYCKYTGVALLEGEKHVEKHNVDCRILVDIYGYDKHHMALDRQGGAQHDIYSNRIEVVLRSEETPVDDEDPDHDADMQARYEIETLANKRAQRKGKARKTKKSSSYIKRLSAEKQEQNKTTMLSRQADLVYVSPMLRGYALQNKLWLQFYIDDVEPVVWNDEAYDHLVYPEEQKDLVLSFVENHQRTRYSGLAMDDVIKGKGQGLVFLLSGPPGTGKTLTAEAVADRTRRPLYYLQAEDLGINASQLGANLKKVFEMSTEWDAVILLDEADVFMAERNPHDIVRNELVSIFLRELEYFRGIIFLTTNLYDTIDSAFRSRVNIHLLFNTLSPEHRLILWRKFLERLPPMKVQPASIQELVEDDPQNDCLSNEYEDKQLQKVTRAVDGLSEEDLKELAQWDLNGREIKNAIKTVKSWCDAKGYEMNLSRLESGIKVTAPNTTKRVSADSGLYD